MDPAQVEHMDSFAVLSFDSEEAAATRTALMTRPDSGMHDMDETIGDASVSLEANQGGMGSVVAFKRESGSCLSTPLILMAIPFSWIGQL